MDMIIGLRANNIEGCCLFEGAVLLGAKKPHQELKVEVKEIWNVKINSFEKASISCSPQVKECFE